MGIRCKVIIAIVAACISAETIAQNLSPAGNVPEWFLSPAEGEYVGVSLPIKDGEARTSSAVMSALMSYFVQNTSRVQHTDVTTSSMNVSYTITRSYFNSNSEYFISVQIDTTGSDMFSANCVMLTEALQEGSDKLKYRIAESLALSYDNLKYRFEFNETEQKQAGMIYWTDRYGAVHGFDSTSCDTYNYPDIKMAPCHWGLMYSCNQSIHMAYMLILCSKHNAGQSRIFPLSILKNYLFSEYHEKAYSKYLHIAPVQK